MCNKPSCLKSVLHASHSSTRINEILGELGLPPLGRRLRGKSFGWLDLYMVCTCKSRKYRNLHELDKTYPIFLGIAPAPRTNHNQTKPNIKPKSNQATAQTNNKKTKTKPSTTQTKTRTTNKHQRKPNHQATPKSQTQSPHSKPKQENLEQRAKKYSYTWISTHIIFDN